MQKGDIEGGSNMLGYIALGALGGMVLFCAAIALAVYFNGNCVGGFDYDEN